MDSLVDTLKIIKSIVGEKYFSDDIAFARALCSGVRHKRIECSRCAAVCPVGAIEVGRSNVEIDSSKCMHCGACIAACPTQALSSTWLEWKTLVRDGLKSLERTGGHPAVACEKALAAAGLGKGAFGRGEIVSLPCLQRVDEALLMTLAASGARSIHMVSGDCATCEVVGCGCASLQWLQAVKHAREMLEAVGSEVRIEVLDYSSESTAPAAASDGAAGSLTRRELFSGLRDEAGNAASVALEQTMADSKYSAIAQVLGFDFAGGNSKLDASRSRICQWAMVALAISAYGSPEQALQAIGDKRIDTRVFASIAIDLQKCTHCMLCEAYCRSHAIEKIMDDRKVAGLVLHPDRCVQCGVCASMCRDSAIAIEPSVRVADILCERATTVDFA